MADSDESEQPHHPRLDRLVDGAVEAEFESGRHEETVAEAKRHLVVRVARITVGVAVLVVGIVLLMAPGPGLVVVALGLGLLAQDVPFAARLLHQVRRRLPQNEDGKLPPKTIVMMATACVAALAVSGWLTFLRPD